MQIARGRPPQTSTEQRTETFTGEVWADPVIRNDRVTVNNIFFPPGCRTFWHHHEHGQLLHVTTGLGLICSEGERPHLLRPGDTVWIPPGERHWHGGTPCSCMAHVAMSFGVTTWHGEVDEADYARESLDVDLPTFDADVSVP